MSGRLVYVIGSSGVGKDTVLAGLRASLPAGSRVAFVPRAITRPADAGGEHHVALSPAEFAVRRDAGLFALHWDSHGLSYGVGREIDLWMEAGLTVIVNGSRAYLNEALRRYPTLLPVVITASQATLRARLQARGRETASQIDQRLARADALSVDVAHAVRIDNTGPVEHAVEQLRKLLCPIGAET
ncbi:MAG: phosphonate metabolism protein/1,5-bisphosphokinase (PRPP-forming) PhnN [Rhodospirillaceae bacterium]